MYWHTNNIKIENNSFKEVSFKNRKCYYFNDTIKFEDLILIIFYLTKNHTKNVDV